MQDPAELLSAGVRLIWGDDFGFAMMPHGDYVSEYEVDTKQLGIPALEVRWASTNGGRVMAGPLRLDPGHGTLAAPTSRPDVDGDPASDISCLGDRIAGIGASC